MAQDTFVVITAAQLYRECVTFVGGIDNTISVVFGRRELTKQVNQGANRAGRICFIPGDDAGKAGQYTGAKMGSRFRQAMTRVELCSVHCWGYDPSNPNDESVQYEAERRVEDLLLNSLRASAEGRIHYQDPEWVIAPVERVFGAAKWVRFLLEVPVLQVSQAKNVTVIENALSASYAAPPS